MSIDPNPRQPNRKALKTIATAAFVAAALICILAKTGIIPVK